jgi:hypothetical protein
MDLGEGSARLHKTTSAHKAAQQTAEKRIRPSKAEAKTGYQPIRRTVRPSELLSHYGNHNTIP